MTTGQAPQSTAFGRQVKQWRRQRGVSQLDLAMRSDISQRYMSFIETGRSRPGEDVVLRVADALNLPIRERNSLLVAAGLAAKFPELPMSDKNIAPFRTAISRMLETHHPYPAYVVNRWWDVIDANPVGRVLFPQDPDNPLNAVDVFLAPGPVQDMIENFSEVAWSFLHRLRDEVANSGEDARLQALLERAEKYLEQVEPPGNTPNSGTELVICPRLNVGGQSLKTISMVARFGGTREVNLDELRVELFYPADAVAEELFQSMAKTLEKLGQ